MGGYVTFYSNGVQNSYYYSRFKDPITNQFDMLDGKYLFIRCKKDDASDDVVNMLYVSGYFSPG